MLQEALMPHTHIKEVCEMGFKSLQTTYCKTLILFEILKLSCSESVIDCNNLYGESQMEPYSARIKAGDQVSWIMLLLLLTNSLLCLQHSRNLGTTF